MFAKRHYEEVASVLAGLRAEARQRGGGEQAFAILDRVVEAFADRFRHMEPSFKGDLFRKAAGYGKR